MWNYLKNYTNYLQKIMMRNKNFAAFILTNGRPQKVKTYSALKKLGYTGRIILMVDDLDKTKDEYIKEYGDEVYIFDKKAIAKTFDTADNFNDMRTIVYARNASFQVAKELGIEYFIQLDDDYTDFRYKYTDKGEYCDKYILQLDKAFDLILDYYKSIPALSIAMSQGGDFIGGKNSGMAKDIKMKRKCMNTFFLSTKREFQFLGRVNEDVNTYSHMGSKGALFLTLGNVAINQMQTQSNSGGMTEMYLDSGTYVKTFYSIMYQPSSVKVSVMGGTQNRLHHKVKWNNTVPKILSETKRKTL